MAESKIKALPSLHRLMELFDYDQSTGSLVRRRAPPCARFGHVNEQGYLRVKIGRQVYLAHRLIWKIATGQEPPALIDHIDGDTLNNRISNLRAANHGQNQQNAPVQRNNKSGHKGVSWSKTHRSWQASIMSDGRVKWLGRYKNIDDAVVIVTNARNRLHGEFARQV